MPGAPDYRRRLGRAVLAATIACSGGPSATASPLPNDDPLEVHAPNAIAFVNARVVAMTGPEVSEPSTVIVRDGVVERIEPSGATPPADATVIDAAGRYLAPALIDMHVHLRRADLPAYLRAGIGTVRNMWGHSGIPPLMRDVRDHTVLGPQIFSTSPGVDGTPPQWPETQLLTDPANADTLVARLASEGWIAVKVYQSLTLAAYDAVIAAARAHGIPAMGHVPSAVTIQHALASGQRSIEHLGGYDRAVSRQGRLGTWGWIDVDASRFGALAQATAQAGTWNCPTLAIFRALAERQHSSGERAAIVENRRRFVRELASRGAGLLVGTDAGIDVVAPGTSMHDELAEFVAAGFTPYEALLGATREAGRFLGVDKLGTVVPGAPAYLLLLEANPLTDIANARRLSGIVLAGEWSSRAKLGG